MGLQLAEGRERAVATRSSIYWMVLGLVIERPSYGYELRQRFERDYGDLIKLSSESRIYSALDVLVEKGLIEMVEVARSDVGRQPKPVYRATPSGTEAYQAWLVTQIHEERRHAQLFTRQIAGFAQREPRAALQVVERYEQACLKEAANSISAVDSRSDTISPLRMRLAQEEARQFEEARLSLAKFLRYELVCLLNGRQCGDDPA
jgi:DNA-binding PadR family transcriptional regulator